MLNSKKIKIREVKKKIKIKEVSNKSSSNLENSGLARRLILMPASSKKESASGEEIPVSQNLESVAAESPVIKSSEDEKQRAVTYLDSSKQNKNSYQTQTNYGAPSSNYSQPQSENHNTNDLHMRHSEDPFSNRHKEKYSTNQDRDIFKKKKDEL